MVSDLQFRRIINRKNPWKPQYSQQEIYDHFRKKE